MISIGQVLFKLSSRVRFGVRRRHRGPPFALGYHQFIKLVAIQDEGEGEGILGTYILLSMLYITYLLYIICAILSILHILSVIYYLSFKNLICFWVENSTNATNAYPLCIIHMLYIIYPSHA